jgi:cell division transport system permease protein
MGLEGFAFALHEAFASIRRNSLMSLIALSTVAVCLFLLASVLLLSINLGYLAGMWESQVHLRVYINGSVDAKGVKDLESRIGQVDGVANVTFVTKEQALERLRQQFGQQKDLLTGIEGANPLPNSFEVRVNPPQRSKDVATVVEKLKGVDKVQFRQEIVEKLFSATAAVRVFGLALVVTVGAGTVFIISNTIRIAVFSRRREIGIMKLVGATDALIRGPFVIEGLVLGLAGSMLSSALVWALYGWVFNVTTINLPFLPLVAPDPLVLQIGAGLTGAGTFIGAAGSAISIRRYLRV